MPKLVGEIRFKLPLNPASSKSRLQRKPPSRDGGVSAQLPRISRLMALAVKLESVMRENPDLSFADLARLGHVSATRVTQIMNLLHLAPDLQERLLWLEPVESGRDRIHEHTLRSLSQVYDWRQQRVAFEAMLSD